MNYFTIIPCPLCGSQSYKILYRSTLTKNDFRMEVIRNSLKNSLDDYTKHGQITRCTNCSLVYVNPQEDSARLLKGYEEVIDPEYIETEKYRKLILFAHLKKIEQWKTKGKLLDIGCFAGYFLSLAKKNGWKPYGIEPSVWARKIAKKHGALIIGKDIGATKLPRDFFDAVTLWDVIEHLPNPKKIILKIYNSLKPGGIIALATPNVDSLFAKILGAKCPFFIRMHLVLFSPQTLQQLLEDCGFHVFSRSYYGRVFPISYILGRIQSNHIIFRTIKKNVDAFPFIGNIPVRLNFHDSFLMIAEKKRG